MILLTSRFKPGERPTKKLVPLNNEVVINSINSLLEQHKDRPGAERLCRQLKIALSLRMNLIIPYVVSIKGVDLGYNIYFDHQGRYYKTEFLKQLE